MFQTVKEIRSYCEENDVKMIDFKMIDLDGRWRHLAIPWQRFTEDTMKYGIGFDGSNYGYAPVEKSDMVFIPDLSTAVEDPFTEVKTISMMGDVMIIQEKGENIPFDQYPRNIAAAAEAYMKKEGIADEMIIGPEFEFYIFDSVQYNTSTRGAGFEVDNIYAEWNSGKEWNNNAYQVPVKGGYHVDIPHDVTYDLRSRICLLMEEWGVPVKYHHHEVGGPGQVEIEVELGPMAEMADRTMITKYIIKNMAAMDGKTATLMPKPIYNEAGSGLHVHMHLFKDGKPLFYDENGYSQLSKTAMNFMGGLLKHAASLCALTDPSTNSYKRLVPGFEAPVTIGFATANRSSVIRIPAYAKAPENKRFELRNPDGTCNPYFAYAAILMAGIDGIKNEIDPVAEGWGPYDFNLFDLTDEEKKRIQGLPKNLHEALDALEEDHDYLTASGVFPERLLEVWVAKKRAEASYIDSIPSSAEYEKYYDL